MEITSKFDSHTACICRNAFKADFSRKTTMKSNFLESMNFKENALISEFLKNSKNVPLSLIENFLYQLY